MQRRKTKGIYERSSARIQTKGAAHRMELLLLDPSVTVRSITTAGAVVLDTSQKLWNEMSFLSRGTFRVSAEVRRRRAQGGASLASELCSEEPQI